MKIEESQSPATRLPRQERARQKVELILEAAILLLDKGGPDLLTTNAAAEKAGVSIGTLYQYFPNKQAILDALADREMAALQQRVIEALRDASIQSPRERIGRIVRAVTASYGDRPRVHRLVMDHSLARAARRMGPLVDTIAAQLVSPENRTERSALSEADAFVLTNAFAGVMRATVMRAEGSGPDQGAIEEALADLMVGFLRIRELDG